MARGGEVRGACLTDESAALVRFDRLALGNDPAVALTGPPEK
ncbi:hypothetical protein [Streptomyces sporangiiformans]|nr:hypothetical protein [Streptomyces sporangiiformans]